MELWGGDANKLALLQGMRYLKEDVFIYELPEYRVVDYGGLGDSCLENVFVYAYKMLLYSNVFAKY